MNDDVQSAEIVPEQVAKRRLAIYTLIRLAGIGMLFGGLLLGQGGIGIASVLLLLVGAASLFIRPRMLGRVFGDRW
jgi:hypothetical protein